MLNRLDHHRWLIFILLFFSFSACKSHSDNKVIIQTSVGSFTIKLYDETTKYRNNFLSLVKEGYYDSLLFHRIIPDQIIQEIGRASCRERVMIRGLEVFTE